MATANVTPFLNDGNRWYAWVEYNGVRLTVRVSQTPDRPATALLSYVIDVKGTLGTDSAYVGFTASTGGGYQDHDILQWTYDDHFDAPDGGDETGVDGGGGAGTEPAAPAPRRRWTVAQQTVRAGPPTPARMPARSPPRGAQAAVARRAAALVMGWVRWSSWLRRSRAAAGALDESQQP